MPTWTEITTAIVALYAAGLSTYNVIQRWRERSSGLVLSVDQGFVAQGAQTTETMFIFVIANPTDRAVTINLPVIKMPNKRHLVSRWHWCNVTFPYEVLPGKSCTVWMAGRELAALLTKDGLAGKVKLQAMVRDALGREHIGKPFVFDIDEWKK